LAGANLHQQSAQQGNRNQLTQAQLAESKAGLEEMQRRAAAAQQSQGFAQQYAQTLPPDQQAAFMISPETFIKARFGPQPQATQFAPSALGKLISERNLLPPDSPLRGAYDKAIANASEAQERSPSYRERKGW
jgi:hypothetical protein